MRRSRTRSMINRDSGLETRRLLFLAIFGLLFLCIRARSVRYNAINVPTLRPGLPVALLGRGGAESSLIDDSDNDSTKSTIQQQDDDDEEERYSRQVYTMGATAHAKLRSSTVLIDGPLESGLVYECAKNLALSGVHRIVIVTSNDASDKAYHYAPYDDLGQTYMRGARAELKAQSSSSSSSSNVSSVELLKSYIKALNPSVNVEHCDRDGMHAYMADANSVLLCLDRPLHTQIELNQQCYVQNSAFVSAETAGVYGKLFCDFGNEFTVEDPDGESPQHIPLDKIVIQSVKDDDSSAIVLVTVAGDEKHDVSAGDTINLYKSDGNTLDDTLKVTRVQTPQRFLAKATKLQDSNNDEDLHELVNRLNMSTRYFSRAKLPQKVTFKRLKDVMDDHSNLDALICPCDWEKLADLPRRRAVLSSFEALATFVKSVGTTPQAKDYYDFIKLSGVDNENSFAFYKHLKLFFDTFSAKFAPLQAIFAAVAAQEALKAVTNLYNPIQQLLLYDLEEVLPENRHLFTAAKATLGMSHILGNELAQKLQNSRVFVVGAGAIGCEILKNLAAMSIATGSDGKIILTDMDVIEKSNLSRQLLFRDSDIGSFKSTSAAYAVRRLQPRTSIEAHSSKVGNDDQSIFDDKFWTSGVDVTLSALDNIDARIHIDEQCVKHGKALVDSGTLGVKGNCQVVVPYQSESYSSSADPPEQAIPVCTLKQFPYMISHTIQWARDLFAGYYDSQIEQANNVVLKYSENNAKNICQSMFEQVSDQQKKVTLSEMVEDLQALRDIAKKYKDVKTSCLEWAALRAAHLFYKFPLQLLEEHPLDSLDDDEVSFWSGTRRPPKSLWYESNSVTSAEQELVNQNLVAFVRNAARLRAETLTQGAAETLLISDEEIQEHLDANSPESLLSQVQEPSEDILMNLLEEMTKDYKSLSPIEFEKDDNNNGHVAFITAASNLRAISYSIPTADEAMTRQVAGRIIPAIITTTAFVSALSCIEMVKLVQNKPLRQHRNAFINLGLPFFALTQPLPAEEYDGPGETKYTLWDRIDIQETAKQNQKGGLTIKSLLKKLTATFDKQRYSVSSITHGPYMLYMNFMHEDDTDVLNSSLWKQIENAMEESGDTTSTASVRQPVTLSVSVEDLESGEEIAMPPVQVIPYER